MVSLRYRPLVQLVWDWSKDSYKLVWFEAGKIFFPQAERDLVEKGYLDAISSPGGG